jgi:hypothetical protein
MKVEKHSTKTADAAVNGFSVIAVAQVVRQQLLGNSGGVETQ